MFGILPVNISLYQFKQNQQLIRCSDCAFCLSFFFLKARKMRDNFCVPVCVCVCACVKDGEGSWVFASTALVLI